jgi:hypothetical protein
MTFRPRQLLDLARGQPCMLQVPSVCNHDPRTTVSAHSNLPRHGQGMGTKAHDCYIAFACSACHAWLDHSRMSRDYKQAVFQLGFERTLLAMWEQRLLSVTGTKPRIAAPQRTPKILPHSGRL